MEQFVVKRYVENVKLENEIKRLTNDVMVIENRI